MGFFFNRKKQQGSEPAQQIEQPMLKKEVIPGEAYWEAYEKSLVLKDQCKLMSAFEEREHALQVADSPAYRGLAHHDLAVLRMFHLGAGTDANDNARTSLEYCGFDELAKELEGKLGFNAHEESLHIAFMTSTSFDQAVKYLDKGCELYGASFETTREKLEEERSKNPNWGAYQRALSLAYYSRVSPELDKGDYAPARALLGILLGRAEEPTYDLSYEDYVDMLDDYLVITLMDLKKKGDVLMAQPGAELDWTYKELYTMAMHPLILLYYFLPDCQPADKELFANIVGAYRGFPLMDRVNVNGQSLLFHIEERLR